MSKKYLLPGLAADPSVVAWIGDFEKVAAWAWIELEKEEL